MIRTSRADSSWRFGADATLHGTCSGRVVDYLDTTRLVAAKDDLGIMKYRLGTVSR
jgi:hypothetical protein